MSPAAASSSTPTTIYLVRHGQSIANIQSRFGLDTPLTPLGAAQAKTLAATLADVHFHAIFSSNLLRARQTAEIIAGPRNMRVEIKPGLKEKDWGSLNGLVEQDVFETYADEFTRLKNLEASERGQTKIVPDMESEDELVDRYGTALVDISRYHPGQTVLAVSHQTVMRLFLTHIGYAPYPELSQGSIPNGSYIVLTTNDVDFDVTETHGVIKTDYWF